MPEVGNWTLERCTASVPTGDITLLGAPSGFVSFAGSLPNGAVWYSLKVGNNREAGIGTLNGSTIERTTITATLVDGVYDDESPTPISVSEEGLIACTFNSLAFREFEEYVIASDVNDGVTRGLQDGAWVEVVDLQGGQIINGNFGLNGNLAVGGFLDSYGGVIPSDGQVLTWNGVNARAEFQTPSGGGAGPDFTTDITITKSGPTIKLLDSDSTNENHSFQVDFGTFSIYHTNDAGLLSSPWFTFDPVSNFAFLNCGGDGAAEGLRVTGNLFLDDFIESYGGSVPSNGQVLTWNGTSTRAEFQDAASGPVLLETWNPNGEANKLLVTDNFTLYRELLVVAEGLTVANDGASIEVQFVDSSDTVYVGANYFYARKSTVTDATGSSVTSVQIGSDVGNAVNEGIAFELKSLGFNGVNNPPAAAFDSAGARNTGINYYYMRGIGGITDSAVLDTQFKGFNLLPGAGNFGTSGVVRFYGIPY